MKQQMTLKIKRALTHNIGLKVLALVFSSVLWLLVVNVDDPTQSKTFSTTVNIINEDVLTESGKYYDIADNNRTVSFRVTAKRSIMERLSGSDFTATADMNYLDENSRIPVTIVYNGTYNGVAISTKRVYLTVTIGDEMSTKYQVEVETAGEPANGCVVQETTVQPEAVTVAGPVDGVRQINRVVAYVDVTDINEDMTTTSILHFEDADGNEVDRSRLQVDFDEAEVNVKVVHSKSVPIRVSTSGTLADGLVLESVEAKPSTVELIGESEVLNEITAIVIPSTIIDLSQITDSLVTTVDLTSYLPEGVSLADRSHSQIQIEVTISSNETRNYNVSTSNISVRNLASGRHVRFKTDTVSVSISGNKNDLNSLSGGSLTGYIDVDGLQAGEHKVRLVLEGLGQKYQVQTAVVEIEITE